eukprot:3362566-Prymnesium_polylepis.2
MTDIGTEGVTRTAVLSQLCACSDAGDTFGPVCNVAKTPVLRLNLRLEALGVRYVALGALRLGFAFRRVCVLRADGKKSHVAYFLRVN